jgi:hypothetical protein
MTRESPRTPRGAWQMVDCVPQTSREPSQVEFLRGKPPRELRKMPRGVGKVARDVSPVAFFQREDEPDAS